MGKEKENAFWICLALSFVLLEHNGLEPLFVLGFCLLPILILLFLYKKNLWFLAFYVLLIGDLGRYFRYFRENYASDTLLAVKDFTGYFLSGKNVYRMFVMTSTGKTPFNYLPFTLFWYLPARLMGVDLRFFEMLISCLVPVVFFLILVVLKKWNALPFLVVISLTPFLLDLSSDGSNDNSAIFLILLSLLFFVFSLKKQSKQFSLCSAVVLGLCLSFKQYSVFFAVFFLFYVFRAKNLPISRVIYIATSLCVFGLFCFPFILSSPAGFYHSLLFVQGDNTHGIWGWNVWSFAFTIFHYKVPLFVMELCRNIVVLLVTVILFLYYPPKTLQKVFVSTTITLLLYLSLSSWTTYAYFTFLVPLLSLISVVGDVERIG